MSQAERGDMHPDCDKNLNDNKETVEEEQARHEAFYQERRVREDISEDKKLLIFLRCLVFSFLGLLLGILSTSLSDQYSRWFLTSSLILIFSIWSFFSINAVAFALEYKLAPVFTAFLPFYSVQSL